MLYLSLIHILGRGSAARLERYGIYTMGQIAAADEALIYRIFGIDGELLIDHAWGRETATIEDIKGYSPKACCVSSGQVLPKAYGHGETEQIVKEMTDQLCLELVERRLVTDSIALYIGYCGISGQHAGGSASLPFCTCSGTVSYTHLGDPGADGPDQGQVQRKGGAQMNISQLECFLSVADHLSSAALAKLR